jgi:hypothetical protein
MIILVHHCTCSAIFWVIKQVLLLSLEYHPTPLKSSTHQTTTAASRIPKTIIVTPFKNTSLGDTSI